MSRSIEEAVSFPCVFDILCDDHKSRVRLLVPNEIEVRIILALISVVGLPRAAIAVAQ